MVWPPGPWSLRYTTGWRLSGRPGCATGPCADFGMKKGRTKWCHIWNVDIRCHKLCFLGGSEKKYSMDDKWSNWIMDNPRLFMGNLSILGGNGFVWLPECWRNPHRVFGGKSHLRGEEEGTPKSSIAQRFRSKKDASRWVCFRKNQWSVLMGFGWFWYVSCCWVLWSEAFWQGWYTGWKLTQRYQTTIPYRIRHHRRHWQRLCATVTGRAVVLLRPRWEKEDVYGCVNCAPFLNLENLFFNWICTFFEGRNHIN